MQQQKFRSFLFFYKKKTDFRAIFRLFMASVRSRPPGPPAVPGVFKQGGVERKFDIFFIIFYKIIFFIKFYY